MDNLVLGLSRMGRRRTSSLSDIEKFNEINHARPETWPELKNAKRRASSNSESFMVLDKCMTKLDIQMVQSHFSKIQKDSDCELTRAKQFMECHFGGNWLVLMSCRPIRYKSFDVDRDFIYFERDFGRPEMNELIAEYWFLFKC